jgi:2-oxoisovalerate dehydrogenase E1 component
MARQIDSTLRTGLREAISWGQIAYFALLSRALDELEEAELAPTGEVPYQFSAKGHELAQVLLAAHLTHPHDAAGVYYRSRPFMLAAGLTAGEALAAGMARSGSPSEGRDVGVVFSLPRRQGPTVLPASGDVGAQFTPAAGWAQAIRYHQTDLEDPAWENALAVALGGDGSVASNGFWSALTMATTLSLPLLFFIEDNDYSLSVPGALQTAGGNIAANLKSFTNLRVLDGMGTSPFETADLVKRAVNYIRLQRAPCLLRVRVPRLSGHTFIDNQAYKPEEVKQAEERRDPLHGLREVLGEEDFQSLWERCQAEARQALAQARAQPEPPEQQVTSHLFGGPAAGGEPEAPASPQHHGPRLNLIEAVRAVLADELERNPRALVFGEDVGAKGGVHGATAGLQARFGEGRVFDTSLSEEGIIGRSVGMALAGLRPIPEIQFRKYLDPAMEQVNDLGTLRWRTAGKFSAPVVVRMPVGFGRRIGDPWHSVTGEAILSHTLGWQIAFPSNAADAAGLLRTALRGEDPVFFLEHRALLDSPEARRPDPGEGHMLPFGRAARLVEGDALTLVTWGAMVYPCLEAAAQFDGQVEVLDLRTVQPWDATAVLDSIRRTGRCLVVHEDTLTGGLGGEILATVAQHAFTVLDAPPARLCTPDCPIPYNAGMMKAVLPGVQSVREAIADLLTF